MDGMFTKLLQPWFAKIGYKCSIEEVKHSRQKEMRIIDTLEPVMNQHRLVVDKKVVEWDYHSTKDLPPEQALKYQLFYQMSRITRDRGSLAHDDRLDCLSMAVAYWIEVMSLDAEVRMRQRQEELIDKELKIWSGDTLQKSVRLAVCEGYNVDNEDESKRMLFGFETFVNPVRKTRSLFDGERGGRCGGLLSRF